MKCPTLFLSSFLLWIAGLGLNTAMAVPILLFNTGVNSVGAPLADGTIGDPHYSLIATPGGTSAIRVRTSAGGWPIPPYFGDNALSAWIGPNNNPSLDGPVGTYIYRTTFDLTGLDPSTASITGGWSSDNNGLGISINGTFLSFPTSFAQFALGFAPFSITSGFVAGVNTLDFVVNNGGGPTALRVQLTGNASPAQAAVPEPSTLVMAGMFLALFGGGLLLRRRSSTLAAPIAA